VPLSGHWEKPVVLCQGADFANVKVAVRVGKDMVVDGTLTVLGLVRVEGTVAVKGMVKLGAAETILDNKGSPETAAPVGSLQSKFIL
jgi:hypothetical protein